MSSNSIVVDYLNHLGFAAEWIKDHWKWSERISLETAISYIESRSYSFTVNVPEKNHKCVIHQLKAECKEKYGSLTLEIEVPNQIYLVLLKR